MIDHWLASSLGDGSMTALNYGYRLITFISGILVVPITTIIFSKLSRMVSENDKAGVVASVRRCIEVLSLITVPVIAVCAVMNEDVIRFAFGSGRFDDRSVAMTSGAFLFYVIGVLSFGLRDLMNRVFHAMQDTKTPFRAACVVVVLNVILNFILRELMGANGLALATTIAGFCGMMMMVYMLRRRMGRLGLRRTLADVAKILAGGAVCALICFGMDGILPEVSGRIMLLFRLAAVAITAIAGYGVVELLLRERQLAAFTDGFIKKFTRKKGK